MIFHDFVNFDDDKIMMDLNLGTVFVVCCFILSNVVDRDRFDQFNHRIVLHCTTLFYIALHCSTAPSPSPTAPQVSLKCFTAASVVTPLLTFYVCYTLYIVPPVDFHTRTKLGWKTFSTPRPGMVLFQFPRSSSLPPLQLMPGHFTA